MAADLSQFGGPVRGDDGKERCQPSVEGQVGVCEMDEDEWGEGILGGGASVCSDSLGWARAQGQWAEVGPGSWEA